MLCWPCVLLHLPCCHLDVHLLCSPIQPPTHPPAVGAKPGAGGAGIRGLDLGVRGMRVGGRRKLLVPPNLAYGDKVQAVLAVH